MYVQYVVFDNNTFQDSVDDWCDRYRSVVRGIRRSGTFGMGRINADFHCLGINEDDSDRFRMSANGAAKNGAPMCKNIAGMLSR